MTYEKLAKETNMKNAIEGNLSVFVREKVNGNEEGAKIIATIICNSLDKNYKGQDNFKLFSRKIANKSNEYFEDIASFALYIFTMDYTNRMLKNMPEDHNRDILIKVMDTQISRGLAAINMYIANDIKEGIYITHAKNTRKAMGISDNFHKVFSKILLDKKSEIIDVIVNM